MSNTGKILQVIGPVVDIRFDAEHLPSIKNAILIKTDDGQQMTAEVAQHVGDDVVRCIAMSSTDGLVRGMDCIDTGNPIEVPVGDAVLGRMFNVLGEAIDGLGEVKADKNGLFIVTLHHLQTKALMLKFLKQVLRLSTF